VRLQVSRIGKKPGESSPGEGPTDEGALPLDFDAVYRTHARAVSRWVRRLWGPEDEIEDIVQEIFLIVHRRLGSFRGEAKTSTWLYGITLRVVLRRRRRLRLRRALFGPWRQAEPRPGGAFPPAIGAEAAPPEQALLRREQVALLYRSLERLDELSRTILVLYELEGLPCDEIATLVGKTVSTVWARLSRARQRLAASFCEPGGRA
jgi:RNA polymerase sigma-70 factor (ECF subfamily)